MTFVTGHAVDAIDWDRVGMSETLVVFMGLTTFPQIARELIQRYQAQTASIDFPEGVFDIDTVQDLERFKA